MRAPKGNALKAQVERADWRLNSLKYFMEALRDYYRDLPQKLLYADRPILGTRYNVVVFDEAQEFTRSVDH